MNLLLTNNPDAFFKPDVHRHTGTWIGRDIGDVKRLLLTDAEPFQKIRSELISRRVPPNLPNTRKNNRRGLDMLGSGLPATPRAENLPRLELVFQPECLLEWSTSR